MSLDVFVLLGLGAAIGFLSGVFGVGGGFLLTPLLIFIGVPPAVAVARRPISSSARRSRACWRIAPRQRRLQDGFHLLSGGLAGSVLGVWLFTLLKRIGQIELTISLLYVLLWAPSGADGYRERARSASATASGRYPPQTAST